MRITPSKGGAKDQGYSIKPHMSLELSFVAKGTSANVPVTFRAQDELSGDSLLINTSEEPFAVSPSDSSTHMTVATVTSSGKFGVVSSIYIWSNIFRSKNEAKYSGIYVQYQSLSIVLFTRLNQGCKECKLYLVFCCLYTIIWQYELIT